MEGSNSHEVGPDAEAHLPTGCLTPRELGRFLKVSDATVAVLLKSGEIPSFRAGGSRRVLGEDLDAYVRRCKARQQ